MGEMLADQFESYDDRGPGQGPRACSMASYLWEAGSLTKVGEKLSCVPLLKDPGYQVAGQSRRGEHSLKTKTVGFLATDDHLWPQGSRL